MLVLCARVAAIEGCICAKRFLCSYSGHSAIQGPAIVDRRLCCYWLKGLESKDASLLLLYFLSHAPCVLSLFKSCAATLLVF